MATTKPNEEMKIVNLTTFLEMPTNTLFAKYQPCAFEGLSIKGDTMGRDFLVSNDIAGAIESSCTEDYFESLESSRKSGDSLQMDLNSWGRDGYFEDDQLFAVWETADVLSLIKRLKLCLKP